VTTQRVYFSSHTFSVIDTARLVYEAGFMQLSGTVCLSVPLGRRTPLLRVCCCGPAARKYRSIAARPADRQSASAAPQHGAQQQMRGVPRCQLKFYSVLFCSSSIRGLATPWTYFLHLSLSSVILIECSTWSPAHVLMLSIQTVRGLHFSGSRKLNADLSDVSYQHPTNV